MRPTRQEAQEVLNGRRILIVVLGAVMAFGLAFVIAGAGADDPAAGGGGGGSLGAAGDNESPTIGTLADAAALPEIRRKPKPKPKPRPTPQNPVTEDPPPPAASPTPPVVPQPQPQPQPQSEPPVEQIDP